MSIIIFLQHLTESLQQRCRLQQPWLRMAKSGCFLDFGYSGNDNALVSVFKKTPTGEAGTSVGLHKSFQNWRVGVVQDFTTVALPGVWMLRQTPMEVQL